MTLTADSKRRSLLMAGDDDERIMTTSLNVTPKTTEQHLIVRSDKSVAYVGLTNNKRLCSTFCTIEANYLQTRSSLFATAELLASPGHIVHHPLHYQLVSAVYTLWRTHSVVYVHLCVAHYFDSGPFSL